MSNVVSCIDGALVAPGPARNLVAVRTFLAAAIGFRLVQHPWRQLSDRLTELFDPVAVVSWVPSPPSASLVVAVQIVGLVGALAAVTRRAPRVGFLVAWASYLLLAAGWASSGRVRHNDLLLVMVAVPLLFAPAPSRSESDAVGVRWGWAPRASLAVLGAVYFATGFQKLRHSGLAWVFSDNMSWLLRQGTSVFGDRFNQVVADQPAVTRALAGGALALELAAPVLLFFRRTRPFFALGSLMMHGSIWLLLGLDYSPWVLATAAVALPMSRRRPSSHSMVGGPDQQSAAPVG